MMKLLLVAGLLECDPSISTLADNYTFGDSIGFTITNPCDTPISYYISLERWNSDDGRWQLVDVDVFTSYLYLGPLRTVSPGSSSFFNACKEYGEQFGPGFYTPAGRFRYRMLIYREDADRNIIYSNDFMIGDG